MALLAPDPQVPLHEQSDAPGQSFDCEQSGSARTQQQPARNKLALTLALRLSVAFGIIAFMALVAKPDMQVIDANSKFVVNMRPAIQQQQPMAPTTVANGPTGNLGFARSQRPVEMNMPSSQISPSGNDQPARFMNPGSKAISAGGAAVAGAAPTDRTPTVMMSTSTEQVFTLLTIAGVGKLLSGRFPGKEANIIQKLLLQFLVPATLFKGLCSQTVQVSQLGYVGAGIGMVLARSGCGWLAGKTMLGTSSLPDKAVLQRTAFFQISTMASALSVLPFASEFLGAQYVGLGGLVDLPMKLYMLVIMPILLKAFGEKSDAKSTSGGGAGGIIKKLFSDPITLSLILGLGVGAVTGGAGMASLGFVGKAINALAGAQTAILFLLIGLKLKFDSATPLYSLVCLLATQGGLLMIASLLCAVFPLAPDMRQFIHLFAQGAPSVVGLGVITAAATGGVAGYSTDFAFDMVGLAFPISALLQCFAGLMGASYASMSGFIGAGFIGVAGLLRVVFKKKFQGPEQATPAAA